METYIAYTVQIYKEKLPNGTLTDYVEVQVITDSEEEAIKRATKYYKREGYQYRIKAVNEYEKLGKKQG